MREGVSYYKLTDIKEIGLEEPALNTVFRLADVRRKLVHHVVVGTDAEESGRGFEMNARFLTGDVRTSVTDFHYWEVAVLQVSFDVYLGGSEVAAQGLA